MSPVTLTRLRRLSQGAFLAVFVFLIARTEFRGSLRTVPGGARLPWPVSIFLEADPLVAVSNALATGALYRGLSWSLAVLLPTFLLGRVFCGWVCPLGTLNHFVGAWKSEKKRGARLIESNRYKKWQALKYYLLAAGLVSALFGTLVIGLIDPISLAARSLGLSILPAAHYATSHTFDAIYASGLRPLQLVADGLELALQVLVLGLREPSYRQGALFGFLLVAILALNLRVTRFWCRALCPLGGLLGLASRWSILGLRKREGHCDDCNRCVQHCQGGDEPMPGTSWRKAECVACFNCTAACPKGALAFGFQAHAKGAMDAPELQRRKLVAGLAAGAGLLPLLRTTTGFRVEPDARLIRPPGSLDESHFLARCIRCGECMKVCPTNAIHPALAEAGIEGLWTPVLVPRVGFCEPNCVLCGQVCPTGAIWELTEAEKLGVPTADGGRQTAGADRTLVNAERGTQNAEETADGRWRTADSTAIDTSRQRRQGLASTQATGAPIEATSLSTQNAEETADGGRQTAGTDRTLVNAERGPQNAEVAAYQSRSRDARPGQVAIGSNPVKIGTAFYDRGRCLPWAMGTECIVCEEWCPTSPKAIFLQPAEVVDARGARRLVRQPWIDPAGCIGCGACEYACPVKDRPAVYVTSVGESRSRTNQFILPPPPRG